MVNTTQWQLKTMFSYKKFQQQQKNVQSYNSYFDGWRRETIISTMSMMYTTNKHHQVFFYRCIIS